MHDGNLAFLPGLTLAPAYDMVPMLYAPQRGVELNDHRFSPMLPVDEERSVWIGAAKAAIVFWRRVKSNERISDSFREIAEVNALQIERIFVEHRD